MNPDYNILKDWMFGKLNFLLKDIKPNPDYNILKMSLGEPSLKIPAFVDEELKNNADGWGKYPPSTAIPRLGKSILKYIERRYPGAQNLVNIDKHIVPVPGTREPLHLVGLLAKNLKKGKTKALVTNPFYHAWRAGSISSGSDVYWLNASEDNNYLPNIKQIPIEILDSSIIMYICSPSNPHGSIASLEYLKTAILLARKYNFILAIDECYSDIYRLNKPKPSGGLDAALSLGGDLSNIIIFNSLSKRSNASGMRAGFIVGDEKIIESYKLLVSNGASPVPIPIQNAASALYDDEDHQIKACEHYDKNFEVVENYLRPFYSDLKIPEAGFFLWLPVVDDEEATKILWNKFALRVMPGSYMGYEINGINPGKGFLRISIVDEINIIEDVMKRLCLFLQTYNNK
ncbi:MAG: aminotransferase class I/II-fold pyridoxal phosphate-dependent enzyme [Proteobacteria bacterium]|mgnify:FL=1|jgi:N-succinyldiaminopimelate aminotransferase|nr:aminotransferase class I/II-fold pyridoxal phosphate-dependent enzyme [Pseudomonadota bacterium]MDA1135109.1 aminotransferase class I/II-fold pyridoxal phosphate-dependent enzyme [Pseudomonadota bacterium]